MRTALRLAPSIISKATASGSSLIARRVLRIKLTRHDSGMGHEQHHHYLPKGLVAEVEGDTVRLSANADVAADLFEQEENGQPIG